MDLLKARARPGKPGDPGPPRSGSVPATGLGRIGGPAAAVVIVVLACVWGISVGNISTVGIMSLVLMYAALAQGWNLLGGYAGYLNFGTVIFFGVGAYTTAITAADWGLNPLATLPLAAVAAGAAAALIGIPALRLRGPYFAIASFVLTLAVQALALVLGITHGSQGLYVPSLNMSLDTETRLFFSLFLALTVLATALCWLAEHTRWYAALVSVREDEDAAEVIGVPTMRVKSVVLITGSVIAGLAGSLYATQLFYIEPTGTFDFNISLAVVVAAVLGGTGRWYGPLIGAVITELLAQELFVHVQGVYNQLSYGALLVVVVLIFPRGLASLLRWPAARAASGR
jgi:branched-chain amino acid transport system permease protein